MRQWKRRIVRREIWGTVLIITAALCASAAQVIMDAFRAAAQKDLLLYIGVPASSIAYRFLVVALVSGAVGLWLLIPPLIRRIPRKSLRHIIGWSTAAAVAAAVPAFVLMLLFGAFGSFGVGDTVKVKAADGTSVLVSQDGFDGDSVVIYTQHDEFHYKRVRDAPEIAGWPRVKDRNCSLDSAGHELHLICGDKSLAVVPEEAGM